MVGRNGVFYDRNGQDWDATIVRILDHPISVGQAFWGPYKRVARLISEQIGKLAGAREKALQAQATKGVSDFSTHAATGKEPPTPFDIAKFAGIFAAIGLAVGAIGTAIASALTGFLSLQWWEMPLALVGLILIISGPSMLLAYLSLRARNLGTILDANGWAVNTRAKINVPFGATLTTTARLPQGAQRSLRDPYAGSRQPWPAYLLLIVFLTVIGGLWHQGRLAPVWERIKALRPAAVEPPVTGGQAKTTSERPAP